MIKHFVRTFGAAVLMVGSLVVVAAQPASAFRYFVHGNVHCTVNSGKVDYAPTLRESISQQTRMRIKGTFVCDVGETGIPGTVVTDGKFKMISNPYGGNCTSGHTDEVEMVIQWHWNPGGVKIRNTEVSWIWDDAHDSWSAAPYGYHFVGGTTNLFGLSGSYTGATAAANFVSGDGSPLNPGTFASLACHQPDGTGRLRGGWTLNTTGLSDFTFQSAPWINSGGVSPSSATLGTQNLDLDITGQDFTQGDSLSFSGTGITVNSTTVNSPTDLTANVSIDPDALAGTCDVTISNSTLGSNTCTSCFMVSPIVTGVSPATAGQGAQNREITITGQGFAPGAVVQFSDSGITVNNVGPVSPDGTTLQANISVAPAATLGDYDVTVIDPGFGVGQCSACFSVNSGPTVTSTSPSSRGAGATNQVVAVNGTGFDPGSTVAFGGSGITIDNTSYSSSTQMLVTIDVAGGTPNGPRSVTVTNSDGGQGGCAVCFTVNKGPTVTTYTPVTSTGHGAFVITPGHHGWTIDVVIVGANFQPGSSVSYANTWVTVNSTTYVSTAKIKQNVTIDLDADQAATSAERSVTVTNPDGGSFTAVGAVPVVF